MKDIRSNRLIDGDLVLVAIDCKLIYGIIFKDTIYILKNTELELVDAITSEFIKVINLTGAETSKRKEIMQLISNSDVDTVAVEKATKICGKKKMVVPPFIQSVTNCVALNLSNRGPYKFKSRDKESLDYVRLYSREVSEYIGGIINKKVSIKVIDSELIIEIQK